MSLRDFLRGKASLIVAFLLIACFSGASAFVEEDSFAYIALVCLVIALCYLVYAYGTQSSRLKRLTRARDAEDMEWTQTLPAPKTANERAYAALIQKLYNQSGERLGRAQAQSAEELEFLTLWVHEIKTPIAAAKLIVESSLDAPTEDALFQIEDEIGKIEDDVQTALFYVRTGDFSKDYRIAAVRLEAVVDECVKREYSSIRVKRLRLTLEGLDIRVDSDAKWLAFIFKQLLDNAVKYSPPGGKICVFAQREADETRLCVRDEGLGIDPRDVKRVFNRSFTGENGRKFPSSTGIGLYLARRLSEKLGHTLIIESESGKGTTATVRFPRLSEPSARMLFGTRPDVSGSLPRDSDSPGSDRPASERLIG